MMPVRVCRYIRRRIPRQRVVIKERPIRPYAVGETVRSGKSTIFLPETMQSLWFMARKRGIELKEAHVRDDIIETSIHESLHAVMAVEGISRDLEFRYGGDWQAAMQDEEFMVDKITQRVMEDIRELPRLKRRPRLS